MSRSRYVGYLQDGSQHTVTRISYSSLIAPTLNFDLRKLLGGGDHFEPMLNDVLHIFF